MLFEHFNQQETQTLYNVNLIVQALCTFAMFGVIVLVQVVHYPLMALIGEGNHVIYANKHTELITYIVGPLMLFEASSSVLWLYLKDLKGVVSPTPDALIWAGLGLVVIIWAATAFFSVPCHNILTQQFSTDALKRLVDTNWIRTIAWGLRSAILAYALFLQVSTK